MPQAVVADRAFQEPVEAAMLAGADDQQTGSIRRADEFRAGVAGRLGQFPSRLRVDRPEQIGHGQPVLVVPGLLFDEWKSGDTDGVRQRGMPLRVHRDRVECRAGASGVVGGPSKRCARRRGLINTNNNDCPGHDRSPL